MTLIELLLVFTMTALDGAILCWLPGVNEIVHNIVFCTEAIERMNGLHRHVRAFVRSDIIVGENASIVGLDCGDDMRESFDDVFQKHD